MTIRTYYTINGEIQSEDSGGVVVDFLTDALGSITATVDQTSTSTAKHRYKPYGEQLTTGTAFRMGWVGSLGYRPTGLTWATHYMRARSYGTKQGQWTLVDELWPNEFPHEYANGSPAYSADPSGNAPVLSRALSLEGPKGEYPQPGPCGSYQLAWRLSIAGSNSNEEGWLIQHITASQPQTSCGGEIGDWSRACGPNGDPDRKDYYEAWRVKGNKIYIPYKKSATVWDWQYHANAYHDFWQRRPALMCTTGVELERGDLAYIKGSNADLPSWGVRFPGVSCAGALPSTASAASLPSLHWQAPGNTNDIWNCCRPLGPPPCVHHFRCKDKCEPGPCTKSSLTIIY